MAKRNTQTLDLDWSFFLYLQHFYRENKGKIRNQYKRITKKFLDHNDPDNGGAYLRRPQFEALEMYVFLKEFLGNDPVHKIFEDWYERKGRFDNRLSSALPGPQMQLFAEPSKDQYRAIFEQMKKVAKDQSYPNYIFALTMGTGKTVLMATCIFYEFILASRYPGDKRFCHNALVFAPDKTVLQSLLEIQTFDKSKVVPSEYLNFLEAHLKFFFLDETGTTLNTMDKSDFNIIISNTQKVILKRQHKEPTSVDLLFKAEKQTVQTLSVVDEYADLYLSQDAETEGDLLLNQRFIKLARLEQLGIYVDEAHHLFGTKLKKDLIERGKTSLRTTIDRLATELHRAGTRVVACYNYTGTPYVGREVLPEVVYAYGLREAIDNQYLKKVIVNSYTNPRNHEFVGIAIRDFWQKYSNHRRENMLPKLALFASDITELENELRPAVEEVLVELGIDLNRVLINVGDPKLTSNDDLREFIHLDSPESEKQFILLVNKGREGWNCRSLFGVALYRTPSSRIFVLQATMRCLRSIGDIQETAGVYLSDDNKQILDDELQQNFRMSLSDFQGAGSKGDPVDVHIRPPRVKLTLKRLRRVHQLNENKPGPGIDMELEKADREKYRLLQVTQEGLTVSDALTSKLISTQDLTHMRRRRTFSELTLVAEIARYLNRSPIELEEILETSKDGMDSILKAVNEFNELLYDWIIPHLFNALYTITTTEQEEEKEIELVKDPDPPKIGFSFKVTPELRVQASDKLVAPWVDKSFHLDNYCFDSQAERNLFWDLLQEGKIEKVYFTGMLTHGQTDFYIHYIDPDSHAVRTYYPDFLFQKKDGTYVMVEVKGDDHIDDPVVQAKKLYAEQMAAANAMTYRIIKASEANAHRYRVLLT